MPIADTSGPRFVTGDPFYDFGLTNWFRSNMPDAKNNASVLIGMIDKQTKEAVGGRYIITPVLFGRSTGVGNSDFGGKITDPGQQNLRDYVTFTRKGMMRIKLDGDTIRNAKTNGGAFTDPMALELRGIMEDMMIDRARQIHNDGSGRLGQVSAYTNGTATVTVKGNQDIEAATNRKWSGTLEAFFEPGTRVCFCDPASAAVRQPYAGQSAAFVSSRAANGNNVDVLFANTQARALAGSTDVMQNAGATAGPQTNDWIVRCNIDTGLLGANGTNVQRDSAFRRELTGLAAWQSDSGVLDGVGAAVAQQATATASTDNVTTSIASANFQGLGLTLDFNKGVVLDNGGVGNRVNSEALMQQAISDAIRLNNAAITSILSAFPARDFYIALTVPDKRYVNTTSLQGGVTAITFNALPWDVDRFAYQNAIHFLALEGVHMIETQAVTDIGIEDVTTWKPVDFNTDAYWRGWTWQDQCIVDVRQRTGAQLTELTA